MSVRAVQDEGGYNQGWAGGLALKIRTERRCDLMTSVMAPSPSGRVLEIGCGRGEIARLIGHKTGMQILGLDRSEVFVREAQANTVDSNVTFAVLDFTKPDEMQGRQFEYVVGNGILHHLYYDLPAALQSMRNLLSSGGRIVFLEPNLHNPYVYLIFSRKKLRRLARLEPDEMAFSRKFAIAQLRDAGFRDIQVTYRDFLVPGIPDRLIQPVISAGRIAERTPGLKHMAQSLFISASAP
jgi:SAM-dependent methyltransferase